MVIEVSQADGGYEQGKCPAHRHCYEFRNEHKNGIHKEDVVAHDEADDAFIDETRIRVEQGTDDSKKYHASWHWAPTLGWHKENEGGYD